MSAENSLQSLLQPSSLNRAGPLREQIYGLLRSAIVNTRMRPGEPVDELDIAERLGVSRTPVREAVKKLSDEGLITIVAQSGTRVAAIDRRLVEESFIIRTALEMESVARAVPVTTKHHIQDLEDIIDKIARAFDRQAFEDLVALDDDFHRYIAEMNGLTMLWRAVYISKAQAERCSYLSGSLPSMGKLTLVEHKAIVRALKAGQKDQALVAMRTHLDNSRRTALKILDAAPDTPSEAASPQRRRAQTVSTPRQ